MQNNDVSLKRRYALLALVACGVLLIVVASMILSSILAPDYKVDIMNEGSVKKENKEGVVSKKDFDNVKQVVRRVARDNYKVNDDERLDVRVRESTYAEKKAGKTTTVEFIIDVENIKASYAVSLWHDTSEVYHVDLKCTSAADAKYPETFCIGTNFYSSIDSNFKDKLPYRKVVNGVQKYVLRQINNQAKLSLGVDAKCDDQNAISAARTEVEEMIASYGLDPKQVPIETDINVCRAFEEEMGRSDGGR